VVTGEQEWMRTLDEIRACFAEQGIEFIDQVTCKAYQTYNQLCFSHKVIGLFHRNN
jgi:hypothetical protein